jgi:hypothetical protein
MLRNSASAASLATMFSCYFCDPAVNPGLLRSVSVSQSVSNSASGPEIGLPGRIMAGLLPGEHQHRPSGRLSAGRRAHLGAFPVAVRPKSRKADLRPGNTFA